MKTIETFDLRTIQNDQPSSAILSVEIGGGGAELFGPFDSEFAAKDAIASLSRDKQEYASVYSIGKAIEEFCN